ncbi:MAG: HAD family hydrolase [Pseudomonadales bacterium]
MSGASEAHWHARIRGAGAILFDFDGTLAPNLDLPDLRRRVTDLTLSRGVPEDVFAGRYIVEIITAGRAWLALQDATVAARYHADGHRLITEFEVAAASRTRPFADVRPALTLLRQHAKGLGVITRNCRAAVAAVFPDIADYCGSVLTRDDVAYLKPDARHLRQALDELGCSADDAVMVGDGQLDMHSGRELGLYCIGVLTGSSDRATLLAAGADVVLPRAAQLAEALQQARC